MWRWDLSSIKVLPLNQHSWLVQYGTWAGRKWYRPVRYDRHVKLTCDRLALLCPRAFASSYCRSSRKYWSRARWKSDECWSVVSVDRPTPKRRPLFCLQMNTTAIFIHFSNAYIRNCTCSRFILLFTFLRSQKDCMLASSTRRYLIGRKKVTDHSIWEYTNSEIFVGSRL